MESWRIGGAGFCGRSGLFHTWKPAKAPGKRGRRDCGRNGCNFAHFQTSHRRLLRGPARIETDLSHRDLDSARIAGSYEGRRGLKRLHGNLYCTARDRRLLRGPARIETPSRRLLEVVLVSPAPTRAGAD